MTDDPESVLVCSLADHPPHVPSYRDRCAKCDREVWRSNRSVVVQTPVWCIECAAAAWLEQGQIIAAVPDYVREDLRERRRRRAH